MSQYLDAEAHDQQNQSECEQGAALEAVGFREVIGKRAGDGGGAGEQVFRHVHDIADDKEHGHGFAEGAAKADEDGAKNAANAVSEDDVLGGFLLSAADAIG